MLVDLRIFDELHEHLGVGLGAEGITLLHESCFEDGVVLDDAVMDDRQALGLGVMGVRINGAGFAVGRPARMRDTDRSARVFVRAESLEFGDLALGFVDIELSLLVDERHAGTVVPAVLQTMQTLNQYRISVSLTDISYYSTHNIIYDLVIYDVPFING